MASTVPSKIHSELLALKEEIRQLRSSDLAAALARTEHAIEIVRAQSGREQELDFQITRMDLMMLTGQYLPALDIYRAVSADVIRGSNHALKASMLTIHAAIGRLHGHLNSEERLAQ